MTEQGSWPLYRSSLPERAGGQWDLKEEGISGGFRLTQAQVLTKALSDRWPWQHANQQPSTNIQTPSELSTVDKSDLALKEPGNGRRRSVYWATWKAEDPFSSDLLGLSKLLTRLASQY